jgi:hypothetical protein
VFSRDLLLISAAGPIREKAASVLEYTNVDR